MTLGLVQIGHVNITVPSELEAAAHRFYGEILGLKQIPKPPGPRQNIGAWYELGGTQIHLSLEDKANNAASDRHVCYVVQNVAEAEQHFRDFGVAIIPDKQNKPRFFIRDPGGNLIEVSEA